MTVFSAADRKYMSLALGLAGKAKERTYPNPMVGAVLVKDGKVIGTGYHRRAGSDHAEVAAIKSAKGSCKGASIYVTLEPCDHYGRTAPCTLALVKGGIKEVIAAMKDPNPVNAGSGIRRLKKFGISVKVGLLKEKAEELNRKYVKFVTKKIPYVTLKLAQSLDGKIAARDGSSKWISSEKSRRFARKMRGSFDAVMVGSGTVLADDPYLLDEKRRAFGTKRIVVDSALRTPAGSNLVKTASRAPLIIAVTKAAPAAKIALLGRKGVEVIVAGSRSGRVDLKDLMKKLAAKGVVNVLVEGGGELAGSLFDEKLVDEVMFFISPKLIGGDMGSIIGKGARNIKDAVPLRDVKVMMSESDIMVTGKTCFRG